MPELSELDKEINNQCHTKCPHCNYQTLFNPIYATMESGFCEKGVWRNSMGNFITLSYKSKPLTWSISENSPIKNLLASSSVLIMKTGPPRHSSAHFCCLGLNPFFP